MLSLPLCRPPETINRRIKRQFKHLVPLFVEYDGIATVVGQEIVTSFKK